MTDLRHRLRELDQLDAPDMRASVDQRVRELRSAGPEVLVHTSGTGWRGPLIAIGTAAAILVIVSLSLLFLGNGAGDVIIQPAPTTTMPAVQDDTTTAPAPIAGAWSFQGTVDDWLTEPVMLDGEYYATRKGLDDDTQQEVDGQVVGVIEDGGELWTSLDGVTWIPADEGERPPPVSPGAPTEGAAVVVGRSPGGDAYGMLVAEGLWATSDGTSWREIALRPSQDNWIPWVETGEFGWVVYSPPREATVSFDGQEAFQGQRNGNLGLWYTPDTEAWFEVTDLGPLAVDGIAFIGEVGVIDTAMIIRDTDILVYVHIARNIGFGTMGDPHTEIWRLELSADPTPAAQEATPSTTSPVAADDGAAPPDGSAGLDWNPILATTRARSVPAPATCPEGTNPDAPGRADQARPAPGDWNNQSAVFDTHAGRIVYVDETGETWTFDVCTNTWQQMNPEGPPAGGLENSQLVYDVDSDRTVGIGPGFVVVYDANTNTWTQRSGFAGVDPTIGLSNLGAVYDPISGLVVVAGTFAYDVDTDTWTPLGQLWCSPSMVYDWVTEQYSPVEWVPGCQPTLIGYSVDTDRMFFLPYQAEGLIVNPRTGEWTRLEAPGGGVTQPYGLVRYATGADTAYTYGDHGVCRLNPVTLEWDCNPASASPDLPAAMVYDPINNRIVVINDWSGDSPYGYPPASDAVWAIDFNTGKSAELLTATDN